MDWHPLGAKGGQWRNSALPIIRTVQEQACLTRRKPAAKIGPPVYRGDPACPRFGDAGDRIGDGMAVIAMAYDPRFIGRPRDRGDPWRRGSALMDTCAGAAVMAIRQRPLAHRHNRSAHRLHAPRHTRRPDHRAGRMLSRHPLGRLRPRHCGDEDPTRPVATATGAFTVERGKSMSRRPEPVRWSSSAATRPWRRLSAGVPYIQFLGIRLTGAAMN